MFFRAILSKQFIFIFLDLVWCEPRAEHAGFSLYRNITTLKSQVQSSGLLRERMAKVKCAWTFLSKLRGTTGEDANNFECSTQFKEILYVWYDQFVVNGWQATETSHIAHRHNESKGNCWRRFISIYEKINQKEIVYLHAAIHFRCNLLKNIIYLGRVIDASSVHFFTRHPYINET